MDVCNRGEREQTLTGKFKNPSESYKLTIDAIGVARMSIQCFTKLVGIGLQPDYLHGANRTGLITSSSVTQVRFCETSPSSGGLNTLEPEQKEERMIAILFIKRNNVFSSESIEVRSERHILGQRSRILLNAFHNGR